MGFGGAVAFDEERRRSYAKRTLGVAAAPENKSEKLIPGEAQTCVTRSRIKILF